LFNTYRDFDLRAMTRRLREMPRSTLLASRLQLRRLLKSTQENSMKNFLKAFIRDERGLAAVEYAIVAGVVVAGLVGVFELIGTEATDRLNELYNALA
jgi:pilus assembly protein Flp/PilA